MKTHNSVSEVKVSEVMTRHVDVVSPVDSIKDAVKMMIDGRLTTIPVVDGTHKCVGIISRNDLTEMFLEEDGELSRTLDTDRLSLEWLHRSLDTTEARQVRELMTHDVVTISSGAPISEACKEMVRLKVHHLPVVDDNESVVGIISAFDIVKAVAEN